jgi:hypothetical protein
VRAATCGNLRDDGGGVARAAAGGMSAILQFRTARWIYRDERLSSKLCALLFGVCVALFSWLFAFPHAVEGYSHGPLWIRVPLAVLLVLAIVGMFFVSVGMWWYWAKLDVSRKWAKRFWFFVLLCGFCFGAFSSLSMK